MDDRRFDEISKHLSTGLSRKGILRLLGGLGAAGISAAGVLLPAEAKKKRKRKNHDNDRERHKKDNANAAAQPAQAEAKKGKGRKGKGKKGKNKHNQQSGNQGAPQSSPQNQVSVQADSPCGSGKKLICHKAGGSGNYTTNCVSDSAVCQSNGHAGHAGDCVCQGSGINCPGVGFLQTCSSDNVACGGNNGSNLVCQGCGSDKTACGVNCCTSTQKCCDGTCVEKSTLCGGVCGVVCSSSQACCNGTCKDKASFCGGICKTCDTGKKCCNDTCIANDSCCNDSDCTEKLCQTADCANGRCDYTPVENGQQGPKCTGNGEFCCDGKECCEAGDVCTGQGCCSPLTCKDVPGQCGQIDDGCGGKIECGCGDGTCCDGKCVSGDQCCATDDCDIKTCQTVVCEDGDCDYTKVRDGQQGPNCTGNGEFCCNGNDCCEAGDVCTGNGCCTPKTCAAYPDQCGSFDDGCGGKISCGCPQGEGCCGGTCVDDTQCCEADDCKLELCQTAACDNGTCDYTPVRDGQQGPKCTGNGEFCCGGDECCVAGDVCTGNGCCTPKTCKDYPGQCGQIDDGCGGKIECGCGDGTCCDGKCVGGNECCATDNCDAELCKTVVCDDGTCEYTPVDDNEPGPLCNEKGKFCCGGDTCCTEPEVCTDQGTCCTPKTCEVDYPGQCGTFPQGCGLPDLSCTCSGSQGCCEGICQGSDECCISGDCPVELCKTVICEDGSCDYTPVSGKPGPLCDNEGEFCCNGNDCCEAGDICTGEGCCTPKTCAVDYAGQCGTFSQGCGLPDLTCECAADEECNPQGICVLIPECTPIPIEQACAGLQCGPASNGCGVDYECGLCPTKKKKGQRPRKQTCVTGVCKPFKKKRCIGSGLAGQPCSAKCKCKNGRKCNNGRCCEGTGDGSVHCTANNDCCPGLMCAYRRPGQHRVCMPRNAKGIFTESTDSTATPGIALGAILTGVAATLGAKLTGNGEPASVAMDEVQIHALGPRD